MVHHVICYNITRSKYLKKMNKITNKLKLIFYTVLIFVFNFSSVEANNWHITEKELGKLIIIFVISSLIKIIIIASIVYLIFYYLILKNRKEKKLTRIEKFILITITLFLYLLNIFIIKAG